MSALTELPNEERVVSTPSKASLEVVLRFLRAAFNLRALPFWIAGAWFAAAFATEWWVTGLEPVTFATPDESLNRQAALLLKERGSVLMELPFPDVEDLLHPRHWVSLGRVAVPSYAPVSIYAYGLLTMLGTAGAVLLLALPASGAAAFAFGTARLLPENRRWLSVFAPSLGFPAFYWLLRPWMNLSALLISLCWAFLFWTLWRTDPRRRWLVSCIACVGAAAAIRPDYAAYLFAIVLLFSVAASPAHWKETLAFVVIAGVAAIGLNLLLNKLITGEALRAAYQIAVEREEAAAGAIAPASRGALAKALHLLGQLVFPLGVPPLRQVPHWLDRYFVQLGLWPLLLAALLATPLLLREQPRRARWFYAAALLLVAVLLLSRIERALFGAEEADVGVHHSIPRYWTPIYLFLALPPLLLLSRARRWWLLAPGTLLVSAFFAWGLHDLYVTERSSFPRLNEVRIWMSRLLPQVRHRVPPEAVVYTNTFDKALWSRWHVATIDNPEKTARSMRRAISSGLEVFAVEPRYTDLPSMMGAALTAQHLVLQPVRGVRRLGIYRIRRADD